MVFTTAHILLDTLVKAGLTHAFVNLGSDHPALLEAFAERYERQEKTLQIVTCPNEMVALSAAQGYAQVCGRPAAVIVHVDCGTQALAGAIHNVSVCRTPVFIYAGASPFSQEDELQGSRNEFIHWLQNTTDQPGIVRQYMRHIGEIRSGKNVQQTVLRALQFANSEPKGPVYCWAPREITEEFMDPEQVAAVDVAGHWTPVEPIPLTKNVVNRIVAALSTAKKPLIVTTALGRNPAAVPWLVKLVDLLGIPVFSSCPSAVNIPFDHPSHAGLQFGGKYPLVEEADAILIIDSDIPWLPKFTKPQPDAQIFHVDLDPLKSNMLMYYYPALLRARADSETALEQLYDATAALPSLDEASIAARKAGLKETHAKATATLAEAAKLPASDALPTAPAVVAAFKRLSPANTLVMNESISNFPNVWNHFAPSLPGSVLSSGASSLGWALGASVGAHLAGQVDPSSKKDLIATFVGDGTFIFGVPSASYWIARRYETPFLTVVFNNGGWNSPKLSMLGVHPNGVGSKASATALNVSFGPDAPDYGGIAAASGGAWTGRITTAGEIESVLKEAISTVIKDKRSAVIEVVLAKF